MLKKLHNLLIKSYVGPLILTFFIALFVLLMQFLWKYIEDLVGKGLEWTVIVELLTYASAGLVPMALPLAILLASLMTFGNLGENSELLAIKASGISLQRVMIPLIILNTLISIGAFMFSNQVLPYTNLKTGALLYDINHHRPELNIKPGIFNNDIEGYSIKIGNRDHNSDLMYDIMSYDHTQEKGNNNVTLADSGTMRVTKDDKYMILTLYNGQRYEEVIANGKKPENDLPHRRDIFSKQVSIISLGDVDFKRTDDALFKHNYQMKNLGQLDEAIDSLKEVLEKRQSNFRTNILRNNYMKYERKDILQKDSLLASAENEKLYFDPDKVVTNLDSSFDVSTAAFKNRVVSDALNKARAAHRRVKNAEREFTDRQRRINRHQVEWHRKFTLSFACFIFFFIGAPLGAIIRKGGLGMPVVVSVVFFILYYVISLTAEKFVREGILTADIGMWISSIVLLPLGMFLTYKATTDSVILDVDTYLNFYRGIFKKSASSK